MKTGANGQLIVTSHWILLDGLASPAPLVGMRLWLPGTSGDASAREIQRVDSLPAPFSAGVDHYEVLV